MDSPTARQLEVLRVVERLGLELGYPPTVKELLGPLGVTGLNCVYDHLLALRRKGLVDWKPLKARTLRITPAGLTWLGRAAA